MDNLKCLVNCVQFPYQRRSNCGAMERFYQASLPLHNRSSKTRGRKHSDLIVKSEITMHKGKYLLLENQFETFGEWRKENWKIKGQTAGKGKGDNLLLFYSFFLLVGFFLCIVVVGFFGCFVFVNLVLEQVQQLCPVPHVSTEPHQLLSYLRDSFCNKHSRCISSSQVQLQEPMGNSSHVRPGNYNLKQNLI